MASSNPRNEGPEIPDKGDSNKQIKNFGKNASKKSKGYSKNMEGKNGGKKKSQSKAKETSVNVLQNNQHRRPDTKKKSSVNGTTQLLEEHNISEKNEVQTFLQKLRKLQEDGIFPLKKKSSRFPRAKFFCRLCEYHCDTVEISLHHIGETRHSNLKEIKLLERSLSVAFPPVQAQIDALTDLIEEIHTKYGITKQEVTLRKNIMIGLERQLQDVIEGSSLVMNGSTLSGCGLKTSGLDLNIQVPENVKLATGLLVVKKLVESNSDKYLDVITDLSSSYPCLSFIHKESKVRVVVGITNQTSLETNRLFGYYVKMDRRVKVLVTALRYWAKSCDIDNQEVGTLAPHCFPLMVIHFLQQTKPPVVPVLHELLEIESSVPDLTSNTKEIVIGWSSENIQSVGELWLNLFKFYSVDFKIPKNVVNIRQSEPLIRSESKWGKRLAIEDPFCTKRNQTHTVSSPAVFDYIDSRFKVSYKYFVIPQMKYGSLFKEWEFSQDPLFEANNLDFNSEAEIEKKLAASKPVSSEEEDEDNEEEDTPDDEIGAIKSTKSSISEEGKLEEDQLINQLSEVSLSKTDSSKNIQSRENGNEESNEFKMEILQHRNIKDLEQPLGRISRGEAVALMAQLTKKMLHYCFKAENFTGGKKVPVHCKLCQKKGHTMSSCTEDELPPLNPLPPLTQSYISVLSSLCYNLQVYCSPKPDEVKYRDHIVRELQRTIQTFFPKAVLKLFGSSANGFGFGNSDLDICLTFNDSPTGEDVDYIDVIEKIAKRLKKNREYHHVLAITSAKVPIVKFSLPKAKLEADLSLYNTLALQNTKLLNTYANIDPRVKILGYTMKYFAKLCDIGDASRGSLSSYAYILLVLHFLQQCKPAVIPVLQELYDTKKEKPEMLIDGWNAWFYEDIKSLHKVWPDYGKNKQPIGMLWIQLLRYYTETFKWKDFVVTIKQSSPLTKLEKLWTNKCLAIEDPFDHNHNLGSGLSRKMNAYILKAFIKGRDIFGKGFERPPYGYPNLASFLFDKQLLTDGAPPNDRGCRLCGRIGHIVKECPKKQRKKEEKGKSAGKNKGKQQNENKNNSPPVAVNPVPAPPASAPVVSVVERKPDKDSSPTKNTEPKSKDVTVASPVETKNNDEKNCPSKLHSSDRPLHSSSQGNSAVRIDDSLQNRLSEIPASPSHSTVLPSSNLVGREISPDMLFQLASKLTGGTIQLPSLSQLPNALYNASLVAPPGFVANTKMNDMPVARTIPQTISQVVGDPNRQIPNCIGKTQMLQQPDIRQMHTPTTPVQIPQQSQINSRYQNQQQSPLSSQNSMTIRHTQQLPQHHSPQHQITQTTTLQYPNMHHLQLHASQPQTTQYQNPSVPINNDLLSRLLARPSQGTNSQVGSPVMRPNFGGGFPPPGITLSPMNYSQAVQLQANSIPVSGTQSQQQQHHLQQQQQQQQQQRALSAMQFSQQQQLHSTNRDIVNTSNDGNLVHRTVNTVSSPPASSLPPFQNHIYDHSFLSSGKQGVTNSSGSSSPSQVLRPYSNTNMFGSGQMDPA